jgi:hypothetical protein
MAEQEIVMITKEELEELRKLKEDLPNIIQHAIKTTQAERLSNLHQRAKNDPASEREKALQRYHKNKEEINSKRRKAYKEKKTKGEEGPEAPQVFDSPPEPSAPRSETSRTEEIPAKPSATRSETPRALKTPPEPSATRSETPRMFDSPPEPSASRSETSAPEAKRGRAKRNVSKIISSDEV